MNIPWKLKSKVFRAIDILSATSILYFLQKNVSNRTRNKKFSINVVWKQHKETLIEYSATNMIFEFGAGKTLAQNLYLSNVVNNQLVVDLNPMLDLTLIEKARGLLVETTKLKSTNMIVSMEDLVRYGIEYKAPFDAAQNDLETGSIDACISTSTLEHIPKENIIKIFNELQRVLKDDGIVSAKIDYSDHYAHTDSSISFLNFLRFSEKSWKKHNHSCHYQNRLRHSEYKEIFEDCGFRLAKEELTYAEKNIPSDLVERFKNEDKSWSATASYVVLMKK